MARALDRVGERWAMMIVRELLMGPKRFTDLRTGLPTASPNVLAQRLRELERDGIVVKRRLPPPAASQVYELTEWGHELEGVALALGRWGARAAMAPEGTTMSLDSHLVSMTTLFDPERAGNFALRLELRLGDETFRVVVAGGELEIERGTLSAPDATLTTEPLALVELMHGWRDFDAALADGSAVIDGDAERVRTFLTLFPMPEPAAVPV
ncbi:MAG: winged helix-turn-helix transcriptional regulator [Solirubrobacteraceae bacterium]